LAGIQVCESIKFPISETYLAGLWEGFLQMTCLIKIFTACLAQEKLMVKQLLASNNCIEVFFTGKGLGAFWALKNEDTNAR